MYFSEIVGQEKLKRALTIFKTNPNINSILIVGSKGTGKSNAINAFKNITDNILKIPLNITEENLFGRIKFENLIGNKSVEFEDGLISKSNGKILYLDDVNIFPSELLKIILDSCEYNTVNASSDIDIKKYSNFKIIGVMNPDEGKLSSTILDKFSMSVEIDTLLNPNDRKEVIKRNFYKNSNKDFYYTDKKIIEEIKRSKEMLYKIRVNDNNISMIDEIVASSNILGYRASFDLIECAKAIAVLDNRIQIQSKDIVEASEFALNHRKTEKKEDNSTENNKNRNNNDSINNKKEEKKENQNRQEEDNKNPNNYTNSFLNMDNSSNTNDNNSGSSNEKLEKANRSYEIVELLENKFLNKKRVGYGKRNKTLNKGNKGKFIRAYKDSDIKNNISIIDTIKSSIFRGGYSKDAKKVNIVSDDIRYKLRKHKTGSAILILVDASGSMGAKNRMIETKNAIFALLLDSYQKREQISMISFAGNDSKLLLPFTRSVLSAKRKLQDLPTGGMTPLSVGLHKALYTLKNLYKKDKNISPLLILITDGTANYGNLYKDNPIEDAKYISSLIRDLNIDSIVIDTEKSFVKLGIPKDIAKELGARYIKVDELEAKNLSEIIKSANEFRLSGVEIIDG